MAAALLRQRATGVAVSVASAGLKGGGSPVDDDVQTVLAEYGVSVARKRSDVVDRPLIDGADLVLTMTCDHASALHAMKSKQRNHIFTLREFTQLLAKAGARPPWEALDEWIERMHVSRTSNYYAGDPSLDIPKVTSARLLDYKTLARELDRRAETIVKLALVGNAGAAQTPSRT